MHIESITYKYREFGVNSNIPMYQIKISPYSLNYSFEDLLKRLHELGFNQRQWTCFLGPTLGEQGIGAICEAIKSPFRGFSEVEANGSYPTPNWFLNVDRWTIEYCKGEKSKWNYNALRLNKDLLYIKSDLAIEIEEFLGKAEKIPCFKAVVTKQPEKLLDIVRRFGNVRVYKEIQ